MAPVVHSPAVSITTLASTQRTIAGSMTLATATGSCDGGAVNPHSRRYVEAKQVIHSTQMRANGVRIPGERGQDVVGHQGLVGDLSPHMVNGMPDRRTWSAASGSTKEFDDLPNRAWSKNLSRRITEVCRLTEAQCGERSLSRTDDERPRDDEGPYP